MMKGWKKYRLEEIVDVKGGKRLPKGEKLLERTTPFPYIRVTDFKNYSVDEKNIKFLSNEVHEKIKRYIITNEDIYISIAGTIGLVGTIPDEFDGANLTENAARLILKDKNQIDKDFLKFFLSENENNSIIQSRKSKNAQPKLSLANIKSLEVFLPPFSEQRKIAYVLSTVQKAVEQQDKLIKTATELKKALMQKLFTEGTGWLSGAETRLKQTEIGPVPESWEVVRIGDVFEIQQGKQISKRNRVGNNQKSFLRTANVFWGKIDLSELDHMNFTTEDERKFELRKNDILVCEGGDIGRTAIVEMNLKNVYYQNHLHRLRVKRNNDFFAKYFLYWMMYFMQISSYIKDAGNVTTIPNLSKSRLSNLFMPMPDIKTQKDTIFILEKFDKKIEQHRKKKQALNDLFKTLLHELMTGKRRVHEIDFGRRKAQSGKRTKVN